MMIALTCVCLVLIVACVILTMEMTEVFKYLNDHDKDIIKLAEAIQTERTERKREAEFIHTRVDGISNKTNDICKRYVLYRNPGNGGVPWAKEYEVNEDE